MTSAGEEVSLVRRLVDEGPAANMGRLAEVLAEHTRRGNLAHSSVVRQLELVMTLSAEQRGRLVTAWAARHRGGGDSDEVRHALVWLVSRVGLDLPGDPLGPERAARLAELTARRLVWHGEAPEVLVEAELAAGRQPSPETVASLRRSSLLGYGVEDLARTMKKITAPALNVGEEWADTALAEAAELGVPWPELLCLAATATAARPSGGWEKKGRGLLDRLDPEAVRTRMLRWLALVGRPRTLPFEAEEWEPEVNHLYDPFNANALRGICWLLSLLPPHPGTARTLGLLVETSLRKVAGTGPRNPKVANAGVVALSRMEGEAALAELARLGSRVTFKGTLKQIETALEDKATALGLSRAEIEELAVPAYGLTEVGRLPHEHGELAVVAGRAVLTWRNAAGKQVKGVPAGVKRDHSDEVTALKTAAKDIDRMLAAQSERLDRQFTARRSWTYAVWRARYLDHPLMGTLARRLLWTVDGRSCGYADGELRTLAGDPLGPVDDGAAVELWHPVGRTPAEVVAWRDRLERYGVTQPFKQAHREVYLLTDAERATGTYSNRFAAHVLRQHQFNSLAAVRGWRNKLRLAVDDVYPPAIRELPQWGLRAEFWVEGVWHGEDTDITDVTDSGSYLWLSTDQVRFYPIDAPENLAHAGGGGYGRGRRGAPADALPLDGIPPLVLSEVLRDVDLFVGVAGVGNDPTWQDGGPGGHFRDYWQSYSFGELSESAVGRRDLLVRLVPRLAVADRCHVEGRYLHVRGERHTYKIHIGSANILMTPNDAYLCIVPKGAPSAPAADYLPFEGDRTLALILSKALMLARDTEITDPTVLSQL